MVRFGMGAEEMGKIAELIKECIIENKTVKDEVNRFRAQYRNVKYSYDNPAQKKSEPLKEIMVAKAN